MLARGGNNGFGDGGRPKFHLRLKLLQQHLIPQPLAEPGARLGPADVVQPRRGEHLAEMRGHFRKKLFIFAIGREGQPLRAAQITGDHFGIGLVQQKASAVKELHERAGAG